MPDGYEQLSNEAPDENPDKGASMNSNLPVIQFSCPAYIVKEGVNSEAELEVYRIGTKEQLAQTSEVRFETHDDSAYHGRNYTANSGTIRFGAGEVTKKVGIILLDNNLWDPTSEFRVALLEEGLIGGVLGRFLFECRVKIVDNNYFPTEQYATFDGQDPDQKISSLAFRLPINFFCMNYRNSSKVASGTIKHILVDVVHNLWYLLSLFMGVYLLDFIVDKEAPASKLLFIHEKKTQLLMYVGITLVVLFILHFLDYAKLGFGIGGTSKSFLQCALIRKYLNYTTKVRGDLESGALVMAVHRDVPACVSSYMDILKCFKVTGQLLMMITFKVLGVILFGYKIDVRSFAGALLYPVFMVIFLSWRSDKTITVLENKNDAEDAVTTAVQETTSNCAIILDHWLRNYSTTFFSNAVANFNGKSKAAGQVMENNVYFARWGCTLIVGSYIYFGGQVLLDGLSTTGMFVTNLKVVEAWCKSFEEIYSIIVDINKTVPHFCALTYLVNLGTDMEDRKNLLDGQSKESSRARENIRKKLAPQEIGVDLLPITCRLGEVLISDWKQEATISFNCDLQIAQGGLVFLVGGKGVGKATLLKCLAGRFLPKLGESEALFVPGHLRVLSVQEFPIFFRRSLYDNLTYGMKAGSSAASMARVQEICVKLGIEERVLTYLRQDKLQEDWYETFSQVQCKLLGIARALVNNFEITCFHKPLSGVTAVDREHVMDTLREHIAQRGLVATTDLTLIQKRPRTVFLSAQLKDATQLAHYTNSPKDIIMLEKDSCRCMSDREYEELKVAKDQAVGATRTDG